MTRSFFTLSTTVLLQLALRVSATVTYVELQSTTVPQITGVTVMGGFDTYGTPESATDSKQGLHYHIKLIHNVEGKTLQAVPKMTNSGSGQIKLELEEIGKAEKKEKKAAGGSAGGASSGGSATKPAKEKVEVSFNVPQDALEKLSKPTEVADGKKETPKGATAAEGKKYIYKLALKAKPKAPASGRSSRRARRSYRNRI